MLFGDAVYVRFAWAEHAEFAGSVVATQGTSCFLAMPREFCLCCRELPGAAEHATQAGCGPHRQTSQPGGRDSV